MSNFTKRLIFGIIYVFLVVFAATFNTFTFFTLFTVFMLFCIYEFTKMMQLKSMIPYIIGVLSVYSTYITTTNPYPENHFFYINELILIISILLLFSSFIVALFSQKQNPLKYLGNIALTILYIVIPFTLLLKIPYFNTSFDNKLIVGVFILIWTSDTFAYLVGRQFGKHKLFERISPKKTIEGFLGSVFFTLIAASILSVYFTNTSLVFWLILALIISVFGVIGDLVESLFKRQSGIKDSSHLIPGHGGFLDRLDSVLFVAPFIYAFLYLTKYLNLLIHVS